MAGMLATDACGMLATDAPSVVLFVESRVALVRVGVPTAVRVGDGAGAERTSCSSITDHAEMLNGSMHSYNLR